MLPASPKTTTDLQRTSKTCVRGPTTQRERGIISAGDKIMWNIKRYTAMAILGVGVACAVTPIPASAQWGCGGYGAVGYACGGGGYGGGGCGADPRGGDGGLWFCVGAPDDRARDAGPAQTPRLPS